MSEAGIIEPNDWEHGDFGELEGWQILETVDLGEWESDPPDRQFAWGTWLPLKQTTMLTGMGGVGKSLLAQMLASAVAIGKPFLGMDTSPMRVLYITCEDDTEELHRRQKAINTALECTLEQLDDSLFLASWTGETDTAIAKFDPDLKLEPTARWHQIKGFASAMGVRLVIFDNVTDAMAGDMNDVHQVAQFVNLFTGLAIERNGAVLLLHHPNKASDDWLGSVAWHNKVRSRLLLKAGDRDGDPDLRRLINPKANYGPQGGEVLARWHQGAFVLDSDLPEDQRGELEATARANADNQIFLACLRVRTEQRRAVSESSSPTFAPGVFEEMPESKGIGRKRLRAAMERLFRTGQIERAYLWKSDSRKDVYGLREVE